MLIIAEGEFVAMVKEVMAQETAGLQELLLESEKTEALHGEVREV